MVTFDEVKQLVRTATPTTSSLAELGGAPAGEFEELGPGGMSAREAVGTFEIRQRTAAAAGISVDGLAETLATLRELDRDATVLLFHFSGSTRLFTVFVGADSRLLGCVRVTRRVGMNPTQAAERLATLLAGAEGRLPQERLAEMRALVAAGEPGLALENFCTQLEVHDVAVPAPIARDLEALASAMGLPVPSWISRRG